MTKVQDVQEQLGIPVSSVELDIRGLLSKGLLITVSVHGATMMSRGLNLAHLGMSKKTVGEKIKAGREAIDQLADRALNSWSTQCRHCVDKYALRLDSIDKLTASNSWRLLLFDAYDDFKARWEELQVKREAIIEDILFRYDDIIVVNREFWKGLAEENWRALQARYPEGFALSVGDEMFEPEDGEKYIAYVVSSALAAMPTKDRIKAGITASYHTSILFTTAEAAKEEAEYLEAEAAQAQARAKIAQANDITFTKKARQEAIMQAELDRAREAVTEAASPIEEALSALFAQLEAGCNSLLKGYKKNGSFRGRSLDTAKGFIDLWRYMGGSALSGNDDLARLIEEVKAKAEGVAGAEGETKAIAADGVAESLAQLKTMVRDQAKEVERKSKAATRAAMLEL